MHNVVYVYYGVIQILLHSEFLPRLFISEAEHAELANLVILDPSWLIHVMKNVVELDYRSPIKGEYIHYLHVTGVAFVDLLKKAWSDYLRDPIDHSFHLLCLVLQAQCLIHPITVSLQSEPQTSPGELMCVCVCVYVCV